MDFSNFDKNINTEELNKQIKEAGENGAGEYKEVTPGDYEVTLEGLELAATKDGRPMVKAMMRIREGAFKNSCIFLNRVIYGTKNDANMISSIIGWLNTLDSGIEVKFINYSQFADLILSIYEAVADTTEYTVSYQPDNFNSIKVLEVYDLPF